MAKINFDVPLTKRKQNAMIQANILDDKKMREIGFTDYSKDSWYYCRGLGSDISFNVSINKKTSEIKIDVLDECFLQPFDYQAQIQDGRNDDFINNINKQVQEQMKYLMDAGVITGYRMGDYI
mgnify:CR=1 FL=1